MTSGVEAFAERRRLPLLVDAISVVGGLVCIAVSPFLWTQSEELVPRLLVVLCLVCFPLLWMAMHSSVVVSGEHLVLALFPVWKRRIPLREIARVDRREIRAVEMGGLGLRRTRDGARALVMRGTGAVQVELDDGSRWVVGADQPDRLLEVLTSGTARNR